MILLPNYNYSAKINIFCQFLQIMQKILNLLLCFIGKHVLVNLVKYDRKQVTQETSKTGNTLNNE